MDNKETTRLRKRAFELCRLFAPSGWRRMLRNKGKSCANLSKAVAKEVDRCKAARREDRLEALERVAAVANAAQTMIQFGKAKGDLQCHRERLHDPIGLVIDFVEEFGSRFGEDRECVLIDVSLRKLQVADLQRVWSAGQIRCRPPPPPPRDTDMC